MAIETERGSMTGDEIVALTRRHTLFEWSAQSKVDPIPVAGASGCYFWTPEGKRYLDFNSQLMCTNIGHGHPRVIEAIARQAETLAYANPFMATEPRARVGPRHAPINPGGKQLLLFKQGRAPATHNAHKKALEHTGPAACRWAAARRPATVERKRDTTLFLGCRPATRLPAQRFRLSWPGGDLQPYPRRLRRVPAWRTIIRSRPN